MDDLYRQIIIDRYRSPRNRRALPDANVRERTQNPLCGDEMTIAGRVEGDTLTDLAFEARGCSISQASADMMVDVLRGCSLADVRRLTRAFQALMEDGTDDAPGVDELGDLCVLRGVRKYPVRIKCALLAWNTLSVGLEAYEKSAAQPTI